MNQETINQWKSSGIKLLQALLCAAIVGTTINVFRYQVRIVKIENQLESLTAKVAGAYNAVDRIEQRVQDEYRLQIDKASTEQKEITNKLHNIDLEISRTMEWIRLSEKRGYYDTNNHVTPSKRVQRVY